MGLPGEELLGGLLSTLIIRHKLDQWARLLVSLVVSGVVTFLAVFGGTLTMLLALPATYNRLTGNLAWSLGLACSASAGAIYRKYRRSKLTQNESVEVPADLKGPPAGFMEDAESKT